MKRTYIPSAEKVAEFIKRGQPMLIEQLGEPSRLRISTTNHRGDRYFCALVTPHPITTHCIVQFPDGNYAKTTANYESP